MIRYGPYLSMIILILAASAFLAGCSDDDPATPSTGFDLTLEGLWPHDDGRSWVYDHSITACPDDDLVIYDDEQEVPPAPPEDELYALLQEDFSCVSGVTRQGELILKFEGEAEVTPEITAQYLTARQPPGQAYLNRPMPFEPRRWLMSDDMIVGYPFGKSDADTTWLYLTSDLDPGDKFSMEAPFSGEEAIESRIRRHLEYTLPDGTTAQALEVFYVYDLGIQQYVDENGEPEGFVRGYLYGVVIYAEDIGPVYGRQQYAWAVEEGHADGSQILHDTLVVLKDW